MIKRIATEVCK